jgi:hypothetical protein
MWVGGYDINLIWLILLCFVLFMVVFNGLIDLCEDALPVVVVEAFRHGEEIIDQSVAICRLCTNIYTRENSLSCCTAVFGKFLYRRFATYFT